MLNFITLNLSLMFLMIWDFGKFVRYDTGLQRRLHSSLNEYVIKFSFILKIKYSNSMVTASSQWLFWKFIASIQSSDIPQSLLFKEKDFDLNQNFSYLNPSLRQFSFFEFWIESFRKSNISLLRDIWLNDEFIFFKQFTKKWQK